MITKFIGPDGKKIPKRRGYLIAHNASRFDSIFIIQAMIKSKKWTFKEMYTKGRKLNKMCTHADTKAKLILLDSQCFIAASLRNMVKAFGVTEEKGFFPYLMIKDENRGRILDHLPAKELYDPEKMNDQKRAEFNEWYDTENTRLREAGEQWIYNREILSYCKQDAHILRVSFEKFLKQMTAYGVNPVLDETHTIPMAAFKLYRRRHQPPNTIGRFKFKKKLPKKN